MIPDIDKIQFKGSGNFFLMAGPCILEGESMGYDLAGTIHEICQELQIPFIFKASYRKANRSKANSFTGIGDDKALKILEGIGKAFSIPVVTDIHAPEEAQLAARHVDVLQIPAFLCRQTDLLVAAGQTGKTVNIKKGQFLSGGAMQFAAEKVVGTGNQHIMLTERGTMFGYQDLIVDFRNIPIMQQTGYPVVLDVTHSLQQPNQQSGVSGGQPKMIGTIAKAGIASGADGIFLETHPEPAKAKSDGSNMLKLDALKPLLEALLKLHGA